MIKPDNSILRKLDILIAHNIGHTSFTSDFVCKEIGVSRSHLHRILKNETQLSLSHFVRQKRMERAKKLLLNSELRVSEIAHTVGINNHQNFTKYFKSAFGISPSEFRVEHSSILESSTSENENTIAVLPFVNFSNDPEQEYFSDGITEEIINVLAQVSALKVVGRTSAFAFKNQMGDLRHIGDALDVNYILEGSVRRASNKLRITAQLIKVSDGYHLWSNKYDCEIVDLFQIQDDISAAILAEIKDELLKGLPHEFSKRAQRDSVAHEYYLKGLYFLNKYNSAENFRKAIEYFEQALAIEPEYVECISGMASCYMQLWFFSQIDPTESVEKAKALLSKGYSIAPNTASLMIREAHLTTWHYWDMKKAKALLASALDLAPNDAEAHMHLSIVLTYQGHFDLAERHILEAISIDPLSVILQYSHAWSMWYKNDLVKCEKILDQLISFEPRFWGSHYLKAVVFLETKRSSIALGLAQESVTLYPSSMTYAVLAQTHLLNGDFDNTREILAKIEQNIDRFPVSNFDLGHLYLCLGEFEKSRDYFQKSFDAREGRMLFLLPSCRKIEFIHKHPYFKPFFDHMKAVSTS